jgi:hypothetical protein
VALDQGIDRVLDEAGKKEFNSFGYEIKLRPIRTG